MQTPFNAQHLSPERCAQLKAVALEAAQEAGALIREESLSPEGPRGYGSKAKVDELIERLIITRLLAAFPDHGVTAEECPALHQAPRHGSPFHWFIDPQDGTSAFLRGFRGSAISIGLLYEGQPIFGVVYAPTYPNERGDLICGGLPELFGPVTRNGVALPPRAQRAEGEQVVAVSQDADRKSEQNAAFCLSGRFLALPSVAYRLAAVAAGDAEAGVSLASPTDYDCAGAHALLRAVGYELYIKEGVPMSYLPGTTSGVIIGGDPELCARLYKQPWREVRRGEKRYDQLPYGLTSPDWGLRIDAEQAAALPLAQACLASLVSASLEQPSWSPWVERALLLARCLVSSKGYEPTKVSEVDEVWREALDEPPQGALQEGAGAYGQSVLLRALILGVYGVGRSPDALRELVTQDAQLLLGEHSSVEVSEARSIASSSMTSAAITLALSTRAHLLGERPSSDAQEVHAKEPTALKGELSGLFAPGSPLERAHAALTGDLSALTPTSISAWRSARPLQDGVSVRPRWAWGVDALELAEQLLVTGLRSVKG